MPQHSDQAIEIELLAPARNADIAIAAIDHGADAVYMGAPSHGARRQAANTLDEIRRVVAYAHRFSARVYVTVNTLVYEDELATVERLVRDLYAAGVDALIVQDMSLLNMKIPPIALHASTQCDIRTPQKARFLQDAGFSQLVLPRELTLDEIRAFRKATDVPLEAFVHGALCVSYSGDCQASYFLTGRSANRGECAQICRYAFNLTDADGNRLVTNRHLLSLKDMNRIDALSDMLEAGVTSFKIEGRLKDAAYVKNVVAAYSRALDRIVAASDGRYRRVSHGRVECTFVPDLAKSFNRGYTSYFLKDANPGAGTLASIASPKWTGESIGKVTRQLGPRRIKAELTAQLENGDGIGYFDSSGEFCGFRLNKAEGDCLSLASDVSPAPGTVLYRNFDKRWNDMLERSTAVRIIDVNMTLRAVNGMLVLELADCYGHIAVVASCCELQPARSPQLEARKRVLAKLGDTEFRLAKLTDAVDEMFVPASLLTSLRRDAIEALRSEIQVTYRFPARRHADAGLQLPEGAVITRHDNIANRVAADFYASLANTDSDKLPRAVECAACDEKNIRVMQTRYCLRRELGACLKTAGAKSLPGKLFLVSGNTRLALRFDCASCRMEVYKA